ncbi:hypothetical protein F511_39393 [Dorcoceras hygrometricum]|uniref:Uncharacterized protein n=1 Tax=Dorcoceras hygrometricum TaxID=472368 RepID=A0A2Z7A1F9_9LAMI|nr:hypothetical protein F511_39393 [Dorcoceras hygrometricum]
MGKRRRDAESSSPMPSTAEFNTVFVDTSLDTHLAMLVSDSDTVLDLKRKLTEEHAKCFPNNGEIQIHSLKVKRKGNFYHLPDFMLVCSALHGVKENWFLSADASEYLECCINQKASECDTRDHFGVMSSGANQILTLTMSLPDGVTEENRLTVGQKVEKFSDMTAEFWRKDSLENSKGTSSPAKKKRKMKYHDAIVHNATLEDHCTQFHASGEETQQPVLAGCRTDVGEETPKIMHDCMETTGDAGVKHDPSNMQSIAVFEGASVATTVTDASKQKKVNNKRRKKPPHDQVLLKLGTLDQHEVHRNTMELVPADDYTGANEEIRRGSRSKTKTKKSRGKFCYHADGELSENVMHLAPLTSPNPEMNALKHSQTARTDSGLPTADTNLNAGIKKDRDLSVNQQSDVNQCELDVNTKVANSSAILMDTNVALEDIGNNRRQKRSQKAAVVFQNISDVELNTKKSGSTGTSKSRKNDEKRELSINNDLEVMLPSYNNTSASADPVITQKMGLPSRLLDTNNLEESEISGDSRKKKLKKFADNNLAKSAMKQSGRKAINQPDLVEEQRDVSLSHDSVPVEFEKLGTLDWHEAEGTIRESAQPNTFSFTEGEMGFKKKRKAKKSRDKVLNETDGEHSDNGIHLTPMAVPNLDLNLLNDPEAKTHSILPSAAADMDVETKQHENLLGSHEIRMNQPEVGAAIIEPKLPSRLIHASGASNDKHNNNNKMKKKTTKKSSGNFQDTSYQDKAPQKVIGDALHHDFEVMPPLSSKASECADLEERLSGAGFTTKLLDNMVEEPKTSRGHKRKQSVKKSTNTGMDNLDLGPGNNGMSGSSAVLLCSQTDHFQKETDKGENMSFHKVKDVQMKILDDSAAVCERKVGNVTINESDSMKFTQTTINEPDSMQFSQTMEDVGICEQRMEKNYANSAGDCLTVPSIIEKENQVNNSESRRAQNSTEIVRAKDEKNKKKTKVQRVQSDCLGNLPIKNQEVGVEEYSIMEKANNILDFEQEYQHVDSQVLSHKGEEKPGEIQFTAPSTDNLVSHVEDKDEGVNFKHYFLPAQKLDEVAFVQEAIKSSEETKTVKKVKKHGLPSASTSAELLKSAKLSEKKDGKDKSHVRCSTGRKDGEFIISSKVSDNGVIDSSPTEMREITTRKKHSDDNVASLFTKDKNPPLDKSFFERSGIVSGNGGNKRRQPGLDVSDKVVMKTARSNDAHGEVTHEGNNAKLDLSASNEMTLDRILRSSKRFKKAKLTASQNELEHIDSQLEFVPDSQQING